MHNWDDVKKITILRIKNSDFNDLWNCKIYGEKSKALSSEKQMIGFGWKLGMANEELFGFWVKIGDGQKNSLISVEVHKGNSRRPP